MIKKYKFSILVSLVILYLSLANSHTFDKVPAFNIPYFDKIVHFAMYFGLMLMIIIESRNNIRDVKHLLTISLIPLCFGILIEFMQNTLTSTRSGNFYDAVADLTGILVCAMIFSFIKPLKKEIFRKL
jgi:VanZ family protein